MKRDTWIRSKFLFIGIFAISTLIYLNKLKISLLCFCAFDSFKLYVGNNSNNQHQSCSIVVLTGTKVNNRYNNTLIN